MPATSVTGVGGMSVGCTSIGIDHLIGPRYTAEVEKQIKALEEDVRDCRQTVAWLLVNQAATLLILAVLAVVVFFG